MKTRNYRVSRATVYNTLELLVNCDLVKKHQFGKNLAQYEKSYGDKQHDHVICANPGKGVEFCDPRIQQIKTMVGELLNSQITHHALNLYGISGTCQKIRESEGKILCFKSIKVKKNLAYILIAVLAISAMLVFYLQNATPGSDVTNGGDEPPAEQPVIKVPEFSKDSAFGFVSKQVGSGTRIPGSASHKACKDWLVTTLKGYGAVVIEQPFDATVYTGKALNATNIVASFNPASQRRILPCAHWDSRHVADKDDERKDKPILGADDGGSGVGVLLIPLRRSEG